MMGCIIAIINDSIIAGQKWPIIPGGGSAYGGAAALPLVPLILMDTLSIDFKRCHIIQYFQTIEWNGCSLYNRRAGNTMSATKKQKIQNIVELLNKCNDIPLLDLIEKLLRKSV